MPVNFDRVASEYDDSRYLPAEAAGKAADLLCETARLQAGDLLLDAAAGTGRFAIPIAERGVRVVGADISEKMLRRLHQKSDPVPIPVRSLLSDLSSLGLRSNTFDCVLMVHILHLIPEWKEALKEAVRVLKPEGALLLVWEQGERSLLQDRYYSLAQANNAISGYRGVQSDTIIDWLHRHVVRVMKVNTERLHWKQETPVSQTLDYLERRIWSRLWEMPENLHREIMKDVISWAAKTYSSFDHAETMDKTLLLLACERYSEKKIGA